MWKDYSLSYIKNNRASSVSIIVAALISTFFLSFICCLFYNSWVYDIEQIIIKEGDWQGRIVEKLEEEDIDIIESYANIKRVIVNEELSDEENTTIDLYFYNMRAIYKDMPLILEKLGLEKETATYHVTLLSKYLIHDPTDKQPPLLLTFYLVVLALVSASLILIIRNSFSVSMRARIHQFGIFSSIGATPKQILTCLMQEAFLLSLIPIFLGSILGVFFSAGVLQVMEHMAQDIVGRHEGTFTYHPLIFVITIFVSLFTVLISAWIPARKLSKLTPLEAIRNTDMLLLKRKRHARVLSRIFGIEGEIAGNALKAQKKALRTSSLSLTLSFLGFSLMLCFFSMSDISRKYTYFEKYQDVWDVMVTIKDTKIEEFGFTKELRSLQGVEDVAVYQKAEALLSISENWISDELSRLGLEKVAGSLVSKVDNEWIIEAPIFIMDDEAFKGYCKEIGVTPKLDGTIILNEIWDSIHSNFRYRDFVPFLKENLETIKLHNRDNQKETVEIPVLTFTKKVPALREEYRDFSLVQFIPLSLWKSIVKHIEGSETDTYVRILAREGVTRNELNVLEENIARLIGSEEILESENRIEEKITDDRMIYGYKMIIGSICFLLALIGIANIFSNTLGFIHQRRREFARYMSIGLAPRGMCKIFFIEALVIAGRPLLITLILSGAFEIFAAKASFLNLMEVLREAPILPILLFSMVIFFLVGLAYYLGAKRIFNCDLSGTLRNETVV